jgi:nitrogen fixation protein FixH
MSVAAMETRLTGKHVLIILLGFFALFSTVNAIFIYFAVQSRPGEEKGANYEAGLRYNATLAEQRAQKALQWRHESTMTKGSRLRVSIKNADGAAVAGLAISGYVGRPTENSDDRTLAFKEVDAGVYEADLKDAGAGKWVLAFSAEKARPGSNPAIYRVKERLWLNPEQSN